MKFNTYLRMTSRAGRFTGTCVVFVVLSVLWEIVDIVQFGAPQPSVSDSVVVVWLSWFVYRHILLKIYLANHEEYDAIRKEMREAERYDDRL